MREPAAYLIVIYLCLFSYYTLCSAEFDYNLDSNVVASFGKFFLARSGID